jgi:hypothetical protein
VQQNYSPTGSTVKALPIPSVGYVAGASVIPAAIPAVGLYDPANRRWPIKFFNSSGAVVDVPSQDFNLYFNAHGR